jgi:hypothetical protein
MVNDPRSIRHGPWIGVSLEWLAILDAVDKQRKESSSYWKREKDRGGSLLLTLCMPATQCNECYSSLPWTSRETKFTRPFLFLFCVTREDEFFFQSTASGSLYPYFIHVIFCFYFSICQSRGLLLSSSNGSVRQYKHTPFFLRFKYFRLCPLMQNIPFNCVFSHMAFLIKTIRNASYPRFLSVSFDYLILCITG